MWLRMQKFCSSRLSCRSRRINAPDTYDHSMFNSRENVISRLGSSNHQYQYISNGSNAITLISCQLKVGSRNGKWSSRSANWQSVGITIDYDDPGRCNYRPVLGGDRIDALIYAATYVWLVPNGNNGARTWVSLASGGPSQNWKARILRMSYVSAETLARWSLAGKTALVTGGTKGIGAAVVEELASLGATVLTCSRTEADVTACIAEWRANGLKVHGIVVDVSAVEGRQALFNSVEEHFGGALDILVNNVGRSIRKTSTFEYTTEEFDTIIDTNFKSVLLLTQLLHPLLKKAAAAEGAKERGGSSVVNISSIASVSAVKTGAAYAASKAAINRLTVNWGCEWAKDGIRVNAVAPGATNTPSTESVPRSTELTDRIPMDRWGEPNEISGQVAFLCMKGASYITSQGHDSLAASDAGYMAGEALDVHRRAYEAMLHSATSRDLLHSRNA